MALTPLSPIPWDASDLAVTVHWNSADPAVACLTRLSPPPGGGSDPAVPGVALTRLSPSPGPGAEAVGGRAPGASPARPPGLPGGAEPPAPGAACGEPVPGRWVSRWVWGPLMPQGVPVEWQAGCTAEPVLLEPGMLLSFLSPWRERNACAPSSANHRDPKLLEHLENHPGGWWRHALGVGLLCQHRDVSRIV